MAFWMVFNPTATPSAFGRFLTTIDAVANHNDYKGTGAAVAFALNNTASSICAFADVGVTPRGNFSISYGTNYIASMIFDGVNTTSYLSNVQQTQSANTAPTTWGSGGATIGLCIGDTLNTNGSGVMTFGTDFGKGVFAEVAVVKGTITSQQRADMQTWLAYNNGL